jgi:dTDP-glucose pyrophosphorylase
VKGWIARDQLIATVEPLLKTEYGQYLRQLADGALP